MAIFTFRLPDVGEGTAEAEIVAWHVAPGDWIEEDQPLVDVMTDKATVEITSPRSGKVEAIYGEPGGSLPVGSPLVDYESAEEAEASPPAPAPAAREDSSPPVKGAGSAAAPPFFESGRPRPLTSPSLRRRAREAGVDLADVRGSGPDSRILREDFESHLTSLTAPAKRAAPLEQVEEVRVIGLRRKIAEKMSEAKRRIPHFAYIEECDVTELEELRTYLNASKRPDQAKLTLLPFVIRALVQVLPHFPQINARFDDEAGVVRRFRAVHLGMATQTPGGLVVPVIRDAQALDLWALAFEIGRLAKVTREGKVAAAELSGSTITLTSLGPLGGVAHTPVINHPEVAIVGPNRIIERPVARRGEVIIRKMMNLSSSFDHRVVDGWDAAEFIQAVKGALEHPATLFMA